MILGHLGSLPHPVPAQWGLPGSFASSSRGRAAALMVSRVPWAASSVLLLLGQGPFLGVWLGDFTWSGAQGDRLTGQPGASFPLALHLMCRRVVADAPGGVWDECGL